MGSVNDNWRIALIAATFADARDTIVEGESGLISCLEPGMIAKWNRSMGELDLINGTKYKLFAATEPNRLRGPQHHRGYCDELAAWQYPETWDQFLFGLRLGPHPQAVIGTTPRPTPLVKRIVADSKTVISRGSTFDNAANLAKSALEQLRKKYEGTRLGRQELNAEILDDVPGALWTFDMIDKARWNKGAPDLVRVVVAIDPSGTKGAEDNGDSVGIVAAGKGVDGLAYVLADRTCKLSPDGWARRAVGAYRQFEADRIIGERNFGGAMIEAMIRTVDPQVPYRDVVASRGKVARAEPIAALYEQGRVRHTVNMADLESQMLQMTGDGFVGEGSPDRVDALVWALTELMLGSETRTISAAPRAGSY